MEDRTPRRLRPVVSQFRPALTKPCTLPTIPESALSWATHSVVKFCFPRFIYGGVSSRMPGALEPAHPELQMHLVWNITCF